MKSKLWCKIILLRSKNLYRSLSSVDEVFESICGSAEQSWTSLFFSFLLQFPSSCLINILVFIPRSPSDSEAVLPSSWSSQILILLFLLHRKLPELCSVHVNPNPSSCLCIHRSVVCSSSDPGGGRMKGGGAESKLVAQRCHSLSL